MGCANLRSFEPPTFHTLSFFHSLLLHHSLRPFLYPFSMRGIRPPFPSFTTVMSTIIGRQNSRHPSSQKVSKSIRFHPYSRPQPSSYDPYTVRVLAFLRFRLDALSALSDTPYFSCPTDDNRPSQPSPSTWTIQFRSRQSLFQLISLPSSFANSAYDRVDRRRPSQPSITIEDCDAFEIIDSAEGTAPAFGNEVVDGRSRLQIMRDHVSVCSSFVLFFLPPSSWRCSCDQQKVFVLAVRRKFRRVPPVKQAEENIQFDLLN
ncbi:hypothetical protein EW146_g6150 [Bondarzewia mesenterica]|uniref:Uncharacterized protein n=1 Tax=Bondarzewia mesenterica TaxID=1095465 RepID=A0A4S4LV57_9AGAM|nr:hypothetical protein EW146_g6150 [Bondarzewia mesenterica]